MLILLDKGISLIELMSCTAVTGGPVLGGQHVIYNDEFMAVYMCLLLFQMSG